MSGGGNSGPGSIGGGGGGPGAGRTRARPRRVAWGRGGAVVGTAGGALFDSNRLNSGGNQPSGGFEFGRAPNVPAVAAVSGAGAVHGSPSLSAAIPSGARRERPRVQRGRRRGGRGGQVPVFQRRAGRRVRLPGHHAARRQPDAAGAAPSRVRVFGSRVHAQKRADDDGPRGCRGWRGRQRGGRGGRGVPGVRARGWWRRGESRGRRHVTQSRTFEIDGGETGDGGFEQERRTARTVKSLFFERSTSRRIGFITTSTTDSRRPPKTRTSLKAPASSS